MIKVPERFYSMEAEESIIEDYRPGRVILSRDKEFALSFSTSADIFHCQNRPGGRRVERL